jgi:MFS family permease
VTAPSGSASPRIRRGQRTALCLITLAGMLNFIDRSALAVANPLIRHDLGLSMGQMGLLLSAFLWAYALCQLPSGLLADRWGPRRLLGGSILAWSAVQALGGLASGLWGFAGARVALGLAEAPLFPGMVRIVRDWFAPDERGLPSGIGFSANKIGPALAPLLLTPLMLACGWRWTFALTGAAGVVVAFVWYRFYREPGSLRLTADETAYLSGGNDEADSRRTTLADWCRLLRYRTTLGMVIGLFGEMYMGWLYQTWLPAYLEIERHMSIPNTGWVAGIPFAFGAIGSIGSGWLADWLSARGLSRVNSCRLPIVSGMVGMAGFTVVAALTPSTIVAVAAISVALLFNGMSGAMACALASVIAPRRCAGSLHGIQMCGGIVGGSLAPVVTGFIVQGGGGFAPALLFSACLGLVCALAYVFVVQDRPMDTAAFTGVPRENIVSV